MVSLGPPGGEIDVRLVKPPFDVLESARVYFDEYEKLGKAHLESMGYESTRYIVAENTHYAIELTLKKGFDFGDWEGIYVWVYNKVKMSTIGKKKLPKLPSEAGPLPSGKKLLADRFDHAPNKGVAPSDLSDISICFYKYKCSGITDYSDKTHQRLLKDYEDNMLKQAKAIDENNFSKHGITHAVGVEGGTSTVPLRPPLKKGPTHTQDTRRVINFLCRSQGFFEHKSMAKCLIPAECQPWDSLKEHERKECFKILQDYDKDRVLRQKIAEAGPGADAKPIQRQLFELGEIPNRWRGWGQLYKREKQSLFENLQLRRSFWENGDIPPEDRKPEPETESKSTNKTPTINEEPIGKPVQIPTTQGPLQIIKEEPVDTPALPKAKKPQPDIIILDDTPPRASKRTAANISTSTTPTIKAEPVGVENFPVAACSTTPSGSEGRISKRVNLEQGTKSSVGGEDQELLRLKEEDERQEQELQIMQRMAEMLRQRNERKVRIAALEARASATPGRDTPS